MAAEGRTTGSRTTFAQRAAVAMQTPRRIQATASATRRLYNNRLQAYREMGLDQAEDLRRRARAAKAEAIAHLDRYLEQFTAQVQSRGGHVYRCRTQAEAAATVVEICRRAGARRVVKTKSMVTEEIHLNHALAAAGIQAVETDLGEYILQLAGETPGHIVGPAVHYTRGDVAALFARVSGQAVDPEPRSLLGFARSRLRDEFLGADVGITGGNFAVAETGTVVLVTNEGNANMVTSQPRVLISVIGMEKLVPTWDHLEPLLGILPRAATGQAITSYVGMITGPRQPGEVDGPEEWHVVILDGGRSAALGTEFEEALYCIRCGSCLNACPVYRQVGGHAYGDTYSGPIGAVITPLLRGLDGWCDLPHASSLCGACHEACPVGIHLHDLLLKWRHRAVREGQVPRAEGWIFRLWAWLWSHPARYRLFARLSAWLAAPLARGGWLRWAPGPLAGWTRYRDLPAPRARTFQDLWAQRQRARQGGGAQ